MNNLEKIQDMMKQKNSDLSIGKETSNDSNEIKKTEEIKENKRIHKKPLALKDLENKDRLLSLKKRNNNNNNNTGEVVKPTIMNNLLDNEINNIFNRPWNKLEKGLRINRVNIYIEDVLKEKYTMGVVEIVKLKKLLTSSLSKGMLSKNTEVNYDKETGKIKDIRILLYDEDKRQFSLKIETKKVKSTSRSKSNVEKLLKH
jgi:hypothetical protein